jgi:ABC-type transporter Mla maintaining outer membrane lipid asymmetry ATPase subunit MlaF
VTEPDIRLESVVKRFDDVVAVDGITLEIPSGSFFALLGPSGCRTRARSSSATGTWWGCRRTAAT